MILIEKLKQLKSFLSTINWSRVGLALNAFNEVCDPNDEEACQFCTSGALIKLFPNEHERKEVADALTVAANKIIEDNAFIDGGHKINYLYEYDYISDFPQIVDLIDAAIDEESLKTKLDEIF